MMQGQGVLVLLLFSANGLIQTQEVNLTQKLSDRISLLEDKSKELEDKSKELEDKSKELEDKSKELDDVKERVAKLDDIEERVTKLEELTKVSTLRSCTEYAAFGLSTTGVYLIDPDGPLIGQEPFQVLCNFTKGSTEVLHDAGTLTEVEHCHDAGCFEQEVTYINGATNEPIPLSQIDALIQLSEFCHQEFYYECTLAPLRDEDVDFAFWTDRHGEENVYFTGANKGFHSCDCHFTEEGCFEQEQRGNTCNCDANLPTPLTDTGTITNTTALPVTKLSFGGLTYEIQMGAFQLGNLRCFGRKETEIATSCSALKLRGTMASGYYDIRKPGDTYTSLVFCKMSVDGYLDVPEIGQTDHSSPLGTISAWVAKPTSDSASEETIPDGWVLCSGLVITKGIWEGSLTPDLNNGHFLRGGTLDQQLETEQDQVQDHQHADPGHIHSATSSSSPHSHESMDRYIAGPNGSDGSYCYARGSCSSSTYDHVSSFTRTSTEETVTVSTTVSKHTTGISGVTSSARHGEETRPMNAKVTWIMKCW